MLEVIGTGRSRSARIGGMAAVGSETAASRAAARSSGAMVRQAIRETAISSPWAAVMAIQSA